jgi:hypothetical protein
VGGDVGDVGALFKETGGVRVGTTLVVRLLLRVMFTGAFVPLGDVAPFGGVLVCSCRSC